MMRRMIVAQSAPFVESADYVEKTGLIGVLVAIIVFIIWSGVRGHWVFGWTYREMKEDRNGWRESATRLAKLDTAKHAVDSVVEPNR